MLVQKDDNIKLAYEAKQAELMDQRTREMTARE